MRAPARVPSGRCSGGRAHRERLASGRRAHDTRGARTASHAAGTIIVHAGIYRDSTIVVSFPVRIVGDGDAVLDGEGKRQILTITADSVTVRGLHFENVGVAFTEDLAAIKVVRASACVIEHNRIDNAFFGIYLQEASGCLIRGQRAACDPLARRELGKRNSPLALAGHHDRRQSRDRGIATASISSSRAKRMCETTSSTDNLRYGLHFMYSDSCDYSATRFGTTAPVWR